MISSLIIMPHTALPTASASHVDLRVKQNLKQQGVGEPCSAFFQILVQTCFLQFYRALALHLDQNTHHSTLRICVALLQLAGDTVMQSTHNFYDVSWYHVGASILIGIQGGKLSTVN